MPTQDDIEQQQKLLVAYRRNLAHELGRASQYGGLVRAPVDVANGITQARAEISQVKVTLRSWSVVVEDLPGDEDSSIVSTIVPTDQSRLWLWSMDRQHNAFPDPEFERRNRQTLIADMRLRIKERLDSAPKLIPLRLAERADVVEPPGALIRPYDLTRRQFGQPDELLPTRTKIVDLYTEHNRQLLILGAPGAGKTFLLHELARDLVEVAAYNENAPIPVIFSLASWQPNQTIDAWLVADLARRFGAKPQLFSNLLHAGALLPLLDGLDEVATPALRTQCVVALNAFRQSQDLLPPLIVTCREREYADLPPLQVNIAIAVQPLAQTQIDRYLAGSTFEELRVALHHDAQLRDLARTPLLLGLLAATYRDRAPQLPADGNATELRAVILGDYVDRCMAPVADTNALRVPPPQLRVFLGWLATQLTEHDNQQDFYLEFLQPDWLPSQTWRRAWYGANLFAIGLVGELVGLVVGPVIRLFFGPVIGPIVGPIVGPAIGLLFGLVGVLVFGLGKIASVETLTWSPMRFRSRLRTNLLLGVGIGLAGAVIGGLASVLIGRFGSRLSRIAGVLLLGPGLGLIFGFIDGVQRGLLSERATVNQGIRRSMRIAIIGGLGSGLVGGLVFGLVGGLFGRLAFEQVFGLAFGLIGGLSIGLIGGLSIGLSGGLLQYGGVAVIQHYVLRVFLPLCTPAPLNIALWLEEARMRGLLVRVGGGYRFYHELLQRHFATNAATGISHDMPSLGESEHPRESVG